MLWPALIFGSTILLYITVLKAHFRHSFVQKETIKSKKYMSTQNTINFMNAFKKFDKVQLIS